ncbi:DoxX family protein [Rubrolithibacter danxiaensis]|uniref:DoxX family protein n=1 Tax=Rubrolithibacter danxiaensis TaxID=3390805 RepID=UPI003BF7A6E4
MKTKLLTCQSLNTEIATLLLRLIFGGLFVYHGYTKLIAFDQILGMFPDLIGIGAKTSFILVIFAELVCGFLVTIGFLTRLAVIPIFITMAVAFLMAHTKDAFMMKELPFVFLLLSVVIFIAGSGNFSIDKLILKK